MSRLLKRVPLSFDAPLKQVWKGYVNPYYKFSSQCQACDGTGSSPEWKYLHDQWYGHAPFDPADTGSTPFTPSHPAVRAFAERQCTRDSNYYGSGEEAIIGEAQRLCNIYNTHWNHHLDKDDIAALIAADRLWDWTRRPRTEEDKLKPTFPNGWLKENNGYVPTPEELNAWSVGGFGHDSLNAWYCVEAKAKRLGYKKRYCPVCKDGTGRVWQTPYYKRKYNSWKPTNPPRGRGFQLWENCSEGSPVSPVFSSLENLARWCETGATTFGSFTATKEQWMKMLDKNYVYHQQDNVVFV
jgi:hypothetical protein